MQYAFIPSNTAANVPCIFEIAVGSWQVQRIETDSSVKTYVGLKGYSFTTEQLAEINAAEGLVFDTEAHANAWLTANGVIQIDFF
jgi:hypothetical protein